jgi:hypothetical protein
MGVSKGTDNFKGYRDAEVESNLRLLREVLKRVRKRKHPYPNLSVLVADIAERTGIHRTTLKRNPKYHKKLLNYLAEQPGATSSVSDEDATPELLRAKLFDIRLALMNMRTRLFEAEAQLANSKSSNVMVSEATVGGKPDWYLAFSETATLLSLVLERLNSEFEVMKVDIENGEILDIAAPKGQQLVASGNRTRAFIAFHKRLLLQEGNLKKKGK